MPLQIIRQDITKMACDAIVNPSNPALMPGGGVDAAIHKAAGKKLLAACKAIGGIRVGEAVATPAYCLPCKYVIHTAGPLWQGGVNGEREQLISCYRSALTEAVKLGCESVAFPLISSGSYGYPKDRVLREAISAIGDFLLTQEMTVYLVVFDKTSYELGSKLFSDIATYIDERYVREHTVEARRRECATFSMPPAPAPVCAPKACSITEKTYESICLADVDDFIKLDEPFAIKLLKLIDAKGLTDVACYKKANVSKQTWYKIMNDKYYKPGKKTVISFAVALQLSLEESENLLNSVGFALSDSDLFDVIIKYCISHNIYDVLEIDSVLFHYDQETLFSKG